MADRQRLYEQEIDTCLVCKKQPVPESKQELILLGAAALVIFWSFRAAAVVFMLSYYFSRIVWKCPLCKREIEVSALDKEVEENLIIRWGNCLIVLSKRKFAIVIAIVALLLLVTHKSQPTKPILDASQLHDIASWESLVNHTGKAAMLDNEHHARNQFEVYMELGDWTLKGYYMRTEERLPTGHHLVLLKMSPTQNRNPATPDVVISTEQAIPEGLKPGDEIQFRGEVVESSGNDYLFHAFHLAKTGEFRGLQTISEFEWLRALNTVYLRNQEEAPAEVPAAEPSPA